MPSLHHPVSRGFSLAVICTILFLTFLDNTIVSIVLAGVQLDLGAGVQTLQWIVDSYMLVFAALMLSGGTLGDLFGRKKVMLGGVGLFSIGSAIAMMAPSTNVLIAGRVVMGVGAAASEPGTLSLIRHLYMDSKARAKALGAWAAVSGIALAFGPIIGGLLVAISSWRQVFTFGLVLGVLAFSVGWWLLPENADPAGRKLDIRGLVLGAGSLVAATFAVIHGESTGYTTSWILVLFVLAAIMLGLFLWVEKHQPDPVLRLDFFRQPLFSIANFVAFATNFGVFAVFFFTALYLQFIASFSGYHIAESFAAMAAAMVLAAWLSGRVMPRVGPRKLSAAGCLLAAGGLFAVRAILQPHVGIGTLLWSLAIVGFGFGITLVTTTYSALGIVAPERSGMAASTINTSRELGGVFGVAILGSIINSQLTNHLAARLQSVGLPHDFQTLVIYTVTHGGNTPANAHVSAGAVLAHPQLIQQITDAAYQAFGNGLHIALTIAGCMLLASGAIALYSWRQPDTFSMESPAHV